MKTIKIFLIITALITLGIVTNAQNEGMDVFEKFQTYSNTYDPKLLDLYTPDAKIIREVVKPDGSKEQVNIPTKRFFRELKIGQKTARIRKYKNKYRNITKTKTSNGIKISAQRQPSGENYWLDMYQIIKNTSSGYKITEEMMQTKVQMFLNEKSKEY